MKRWLVILLIAFGHATLTWLLVLQSFGMGMSRFDTGAPITLGERALDAIVEVLMWPLFAPLTHWGGMWLNHLFPGLLGYIPLLLNSLIWALAIVFLWRRLRT